MNSPAPAEGPVCALCGAKNLAGARYCGSCGQPVSFIPAQTSANLEPIPTNAPPVPPVHPKPEVNRRRKVLLWAVVVVFVGFLIIAWIRITMGRLSGADVNTSLPTGTLKSTILPGKTITSAPQSSPFTLAPSLTPAATMDGSKLLTTTPFSGAEPPPCATPGQKWASPVDNMVLVCVPAGEFLIGASDMDVNSQSNEKPQHKVVLSAYWIDQTEVTNSQYQRCVQAGKCNNPFESSSNNQPAYFGNSQFANYPVIHITWEYAKAYCAWAGRRMPSEAEWEKAARGPSGAIYPWGNLAPNESLANYYQGKIKDTSPVGAFPKGASPYGALDMAGNVMEWMADWYSETYYQSSPLSNPIGPSSGQYRAVRGGALNYGPEFVRVSSRLYYLPIARLGYVGFRCVR